MAQSRDFARNGYHPGIVLLSCAAGGHTGQTPRSPNNLNVLV